MNHKVKILLEAVLGLLVLGTVVTGGLLVSRANRVSSASPVSEGGFSRR